MRKWAFIFLIIVLTTIGLFMVEIKETSLPEVIEMYEEKWGIELPIPDKREILWHPKSNIFGDGEYVHAYSYSFKPNIEQSELWPVSEENIIVINEHIQHFIDQSIGLSKNEEKLNTFNRIHAEAKVSVGDYFYYSTKNRGNDYFIVLYKYDLKRLYTFEWHQ